MDIKPYHQLDDKDAQNSPINSADNITGSRHGHRPGFQSKQYGIEHDQRNDAILDVSTLQPGAQAMASPVCRCHVNWGVIHLPHSENQSMCGDPEP